MGDVERLFRLASTHSEISKTHTIDLFEIGAMNGKLAFGCTAYPRSAETIQSGMSLPRSELSYIQPDHSTFNLLYQKPGRIDKLGPLLLAELNRQFPDAARTSTRPIWFTLSTVGIAKLDEVNDIWRSTVNESEDPMDKEDASESHSISATVSDPLDHLFGEDLTPPEASTIREDGSIALSSTLDTSSPPADMRMVINISSPTDPNNLHDGGAGDFVNEGTLADMYDDDIERAAEAGAVLGEMFGGW